MRKINKYENKLLLVSAILFLTIAFISVALFGGVDGFALAVEESVYLGGTPVGVIQQSDGVVVAEFVDVPCEGKAYSPAKEAGLLLGDVIQTVDGKNICTAEQLGNSLGVGKKLVVLGVRRYSEIVNINVTPVYDVVAHKLALGMRVKSELAGVGTMTFIMPNGNFGAMGHKVFDPNIAYQDVFSKGEIFNCKITGIEKGMPGKAGELKGGFSRDREKCGVVSKNIYCGLFGKVNLNPQGLKLAEVASQDEIEVGKASILTTIEGNLPKEYSIEIVKKSAQNKPSDKSMVIHITDEELIAKTGGIVQGMSGSPIIQNGKLIGAVTHVFINDATRGYGIYAEWMVAEAK